jgi:ubiquitin C-terminal hydrolase
MGNTCYMNSILQCLFSTPQLLAHFSKLEKWTINPNAPTSGSLTNHFKTLIKQVETAGDRQQPLVPSSLKNTLEVLNEEFKGRLQHDSQELLRFLVDGMHQELNSVHERFKFELDQPLSGETAFVKAKRLWSNYERCNKSVMLDIFCGQLLHKRSCLGCGFEYSQADSFWDFAIQLPQTNVGDPALHLMDLFRRYFSEETLTGAQQARCDGCCQRTDSKKVPVISRFPTVLVIHLVRFFFPRVGVRGKITTEVEFPLDLDLQEFASPDSSQRLKYKLYAVSNHVGGERDSGHYTAHACIDRNLSSNGWYLSFNQLRILNARMFLSILCNRGGTLLICFSICLSKLKLLSNPPPSPPPPPLPIHETKYKQYRECLK